MPEIQHPNFFAPKLQPQNLSRVCEAVISVAYEAYEAASTDFDTPYTRGTLLYGRVQGLFQALHRDINFPSVQLRNSTMDFTVSIDDVLFQVVTDNPESPKKSHRLKANELEAKQLALFAAEANEVLTWRIFVDSNHDPEFPEFRATVVGLGYHGNVLCHWQHTPQTAVPIRMLDLPAENEIEESLPHRRNKDALSDKPSDDDSVDG